MTVVVLASSPDQTEDSSVTKKPVTHLTFHLSFLPVHWVESKAETI